MVRSVQRLLSSNIKTSGCKHSMTSLTSTVFGSRVTTLYVLYSRQVFNLRAEKSNTPVMSTVKYCLTNKCGRKEDQHVLCFLSSLSLISVYFLNIQHCKQVSPIRGLRNLLFVIYLKHLETPPIHACVFTLSRPAALHFALRPQIIVGNIPLH